MKAADYGKLSGGWLAELRCVVNNQHRTAERMEAIVKKHSEIMWWSHQSNESSGLWKTRWWLAELQCVVTDQYRTAERMEAVVKKHSEIMWWSQQTNESSGLWKTLWWLAELQCVV